MSTRNALTFRIATTEDAPTLATLINTAFRSERTGQTWLFDSQSLRIDIASPDLTASFIADPNMVMLIGSSPTSADPTKPLTTCFLRKPSSPPQEHITPGAAWMGFLAVWPEMHHKGYGLAMLREAERYVKEEWGAGRLEFDFVNARTELRAWYERCGYVATGKVREFPYGEKGREILAEGLEMVVLGRDLV